MTIANGLVEHALDGALHDELQELFRAFLRGAMPRDELLKRATEVVLARIATEKIIGDAIADAIEA